MFQNKSLNQEKKGKRRRKRDEKMPIYVKKPVKTRKRKARNFVFFRGSLKEIKSLTKKDLENVSRTLKLSSSFLSLGWFKRKVSSAVKKLSETGEKQTTFLINTSLGKVRFAVSLHRGKIIIHQYPSIHAVRGRLSLDPKLSRPFSFENLKAILSKGFYSRSYSKPGGFGNVEIASRRKATRHGIPSTKPELTEGDIYYLELMAPELDVQEDSKRHNYSIVSRASRSQILRVNIRLAKYLTEEQVEERKKFYEKELKKSKIPFGFI